MSTTLEFFLRSLAQNPKLKARYVQEPVQVMTEHGIDVAHQQMILNGDNEALQRAMGQKLAVLVTHINRFGSPVSEANCLIKAA